MIDTHCHLNIKPLSKNTDDFLRKAAKAGVNTIIVPAVDYATSKSAIELAESHDHVYALVGIHPHEAQSSKVETAFKNLPEFARHPKVVGIGECGLDYNRLDSDDPVATATAQKEVFIEQIKLALELDMPLSIHVRDAHQDAIRILQKYEPRGVLHCFSGDKSYLKSALDIGLYISFAGNLTFENAKELQALAPLVPLDRLLLETDAPYLNPERGTWPNVPKNVTKTYYFAADLLDIPVEKLIEKVQKNTKTLFGI